MPMFYLKKATHLITQKPSIITLFLCLWSYSILSACRLKLPLLPGLSHWPLLIGQPYSLLLSSLSPLDKAVQNPKHKLATAIASLAVQSKTRAQPSWLTKLKLMD